MPRAPMTFSRNKPGVWYDVVPATPGETEGRVSSGGEGGVVSRVSHADADAGLM